MIPDFFVDKIANSISQAFIMRATIIVDYHHNNVVITDMLSRVIRSAEGLLPGDVVRGNSHVCRSAKFQRNRTIRGRVIAI